MNKPIIRMMHYRDGRLSGCVLINGIERPVAAFKVSSEVSRGGLEKALLKQAIKEQGE